MCGHDRRKARVLRFGRRAMKLFHEPNNPMGGGCGGCVISRRPFTGCSGAGTLDQRCTPSAYATTRRVTLLQAQPTEGLGLEREVTAAVVGVCARFFDAGER